MTYYDTESLQAAASAGLCLASLAIGSTQMMHWCIGYLHENVVSSHVH